METGLRQPTTSGAPQAGPEPPPASPADLRRLALAIGAAGAVMAVVAVARYVNGRAGLDLPHFDQGIWLASRGGRPDSTVFGEGLLNDHFGPALLLFAPLYRIFASPLWMILGQVVAAGAAVWQVCRRLLVPVGPRWAAGMGAALLLSPPVAYALLWDVHAVVFAIPFTLAACFAVQEDRPRQAAALGLVAALFRADAAYAVLAAFAFLPRRPGGARRWGPGLVLLGYVGLATYLEMRLGGQGESSAWSGYYGHLGASPADALMHPWRIATALLSPAGFAKVFPWLATGAFLSLRRPRLALPALAAGIVTLLAQWGSTGNWGFHYGIAPALLLALAWIPSVREQPERARLIVASIALMSVAGGPFTPAPLFDTGARRASYFFTSDEAARCIVDGIPADAGFAGAEETVGLVAHRRRLFYWPYPFVGIAKFPSLRTPPAGLADEVDYVVIRSGDKNGVPAGFVPDGAAGQYARFRREGTTVANAPACASSSSARGADT